MCGIAGILQTHSTAISPRTLQQLSQSLYHRGPDDYGYLTYSPQTAIAVSRDPDQLPPGNLGLIHRRLFILDLSTAGWQPMTTQDKRYAITFNGEIYNYLELQQELKSLGYTFHSQSDTEVLLTAYVHSHIPYASRERLIIQEIKSQINPLRSIILQRFQGLSLILIKMPPHTIRTK